MDPTLRFRIDQIRQAIEATEAEVAALSVDGPVAARARALVVTKLDEARLWLRELRGPE